MTATENDFLGEVSRFIAAHDGPEWLQDRGLIAWHVLRNRLVWRSDKMGLTAVMFFWQLEDPREIETKVVNEIEGRGESIYIPFLAMEERVRFKDLIGGMLDYAVDSCGCKIKWMTFERMDGSIHRYGMREKNGIV